jgi:hypothetical protein
MRQAATVVLLVAVAIVPGCGGEDEVDISGTWSGTMTDEEGSRTVAGNCTQSDREARCVLSVTDPARGTTSRATLNGVVARDVASSNSSFSFGLGVTAPPCSINVSGLATVAGGSMDASYAGLNSCMTGPLRDGRLSLIRQ